jgi:hypothetical protein
MTRIGITIEIIEVEPVINPVPAPVPEPVPSK